MFRLRCRGGSAMKKLTDKQQQIYDYIVAFQKDHGYPP